MIQAKVLNLLLLSASLCLLASCGDSVSEQYPLEEEVSKIVSNIKGDVERRKDQINNIDLTNKKLEEITGELRKLVDELKKIKDNQVNNDLDRVLRLNNPDSIIVNLTEINHALESRIFSVFTAYGINLRSNRMSAQPIASSYELDYPLEAEVFGSPYAISSGYYSNRQSSNLNVNYTLENCFNSVFNIERQLGDLRRNFNSNKVKGIVNRLRLESFENDLRQLINLIESNRKDLINRIKDANNELLTKEKYLSELQSGLRLIEKQRIDKILLIYVLPGFGIILLLMIYIPRLYHEPEIKKIIFEKGLLLQLITVFLLTISILILGIGDKINSEVLGTLLGGISVYVLQSARNLNINEPK